MRDTRRVRGLITGGAMAAALVAGTIGLAAAPSSAAGIGGCSISGNNNGAIGVPQQLNVQDCVGAGLVTVTYANGSAPQQVQIFPGPGDTGIASWVPNATGQAALSLGGTTFATSTIARTGTITQISTPNTAPINQPTKVLVTVQSNSPSAYQPTGQVVVRNPNGAVLQTMGLTPGPGAGQSFAYYWFTPTTTGTFFFQATYNGDANATTSISPQDTIIATPSGGTISLAAPSTMTQGVPVTLVASVAPAGTQGSVGFTLNGAPISASIPIQANGTASFVWTPNVVGQVTLGANYTTNQGGSGSTRSQVTIVAGPAQRDVITLIQPGWGPWNPNGTYTLGNGTTFAFQASTLSGAPVTLSETGPCQVSGLTLVIDTGSGQCNLVATSAGGNGYAGVQQGYTVQMVPGTQTAALAAPNSGTFSKGRTIRLQNPSQGQTSAGQNVTWRVTSGGNRCRIRYPSNGAVNLQLQRAGTCNVRATAPAVPGQWNAFRLDRSYRAR